MTPFDDLLFSIAYALKMKARMPRATKARDIKLDDYVPVARVIVEQLKLSGYEITKRAPRDQNFAVPPSPKAK